MLGPQPNPYEQVRGDSSFMNPFGGGGRAEFCVYVGGQGRRRVVASQALHALGPRPNPYQQEGWRLITLMSRGGGSGAGQDDCGSGEEDGGAA